MYNPIQFERKAILTHRTQQFYTKPTKGDYLLTWYFSYTHIRCCEVISKHGAIKLVALEINNNNNKNNNNMADAPRLRLVSLTA